MIGRDSYVTERSNRAEPTVDDAADLAVEPDIIEIVLGGLRLARILLRGIVHVARSAAEQRVVVERHLGSRARARGRPWSPPAD